MNFIEACVKVSQGHKIRLPHWPDGTYVTSHTSGVFGPGEGQRTLKIWRTPQTEAYPNIGFFVSQTLLQQKVDTPFLLTDILSTDWELVREPMTFMQAVEAMKQGKAVRRRHWGEDEAVCYRHASFCFESSYDGRQQRAREHGFECRGSISFDDVIATDWEIVE